MAKYYYQEEVRHAGLNKYKIIKAETQYELAQKVAVTRAQWDEQWKRKCDLEKQRQERELARYNIEQALEYAMERTRQTEEEIVRINNLLQNKGTSLQRKDLYDKSIFSVKEPTQEAFEFYPREPHRMDAQYNGSMPILAMFKKKKKEEYIRENDSKFQLDYAAWKNRVVAIDKKNEERKQSYEKRKNEWQTQKNEYLCKQQQYNAQIDNMFVSYEKGNKEAIEKYFSILLNRISLPVVYDKDVEVEYNLENRMLIIDLILPNIEDFPNVKKITYVKSTGEYKETLQSDAFMKKLYDKAVYDIVLLFLNDVFGQDQHNYIKAIVLNGRVNTIDKTTGKEISPYILSINISKESFGELNVDYIDSREWFKSAKGISAATFAKVTPVAPVVRMSKEDKRFVDGHTVTENIDESVNLAAMDWQDFENLIREIFEEEFKSNGGEVKITQASRDGGVDAVAFDPDPIRGGKIVIQAKRYTNVVGVSAVRDLYGTVMNEGATKGILVTTSNYGNDAYEFAKGKPLTLMNGAHLLYLLEKHGHKARIDLAEAKEKMKSNIS